jgi:ABC-type antimicrobial peptide transport system permease subunit
MWMILRPSAGPGVDPDAAAAALAPAVRAALREIDPAMPISSLAPMAELLGEDMARPRGLAAVTGLFAVLALVLAAAGVYAVLAYSVAQRTAEMGVRFALGAQLGDIVRLVLGDAMRLGAIGVTLGIAVALVAGRALQSVLFNVSAADPVAVGATAALLAAALLAAALLPARRAARVDPVVAMRDS